MIEKTADGTTRRMSQSERAGMLGVAYVATFTRHHPARVLVRLGTHDGPPIVETFAVPGEHPMDLIRRALDHAEGTLAVAGCAAPGARSSRRVMIST